MSRHSRKDSCLYKIENHHIELYPPVYLHSQLNLRLLKQEEKHSWPFPSLTCVASISICTEAGAS